MSFDLRKYDSPEAVSAAAASWIAQLVKAAIAARGVCTMALSGGRTPAAMLQALAIEILPWRYVHVFQVDERVTAYRDSNRNLVQLRSAFQATALPQNRIHAMPVEVDDLQGAASVYAATLEAVAGQPPVLDIVHLGLGADGHTASLVPGDPVLDEAQRDVATTEIYAGYRRLTLTLPCLARARSLIWLVTGTDKAEAVARVLARDPLVPASRLSACRSVIFVDQAAATELERQHFIDGA